MLYQVAYTEVILLSSGIMHFTSTVITVTVFIVLYFSTRPKKIDQLENKDKKWPTWGSIREISVSNLETGR